MKQKEKTLVAVGVGLWTLMVAAGITIRSTVGGVGLLMGWSISRYMGGEVWSAWLLALANAVLLMMTARYMWRLGERLEMRKIWYVMIVLMGAGLLLLSMFPAHMFDDATTTISIVTFAHQIASRTMFVAMGVMGLMLALNKKASRSLRIAGGVFAFYTVECVLAFFLNVPEFMDNKLIWESGYIVGYFVMLLF